MFLHKGLGRNDDGCPSIGGRTALKLGERVMHGLRVHNLVHRVFLLKLRIRIKSTVLVIFVGDFRKMTFLGSILFLMLPSRVSEHLRRRWSTTELLQLHHNSKMLIDRIGTII